MILFICVLQLLDWHLHLDAGLPDPLGSVGVWLHQAEKILQEELVPHQSHEETADALQRTRQLHQVDEKSQQAESNEERCVQRGEHTRDCDGCVRDFVFHRRSSAWLKCSSRPSSVFTGISRVSAMFLYLLSSSRTWQRGGRKTKESELKTCAISLIY